MSSDTLTAWSAVMKDVQAVSKDGRNTHQNFNFRGIDQVMNAVGPALRKHDVLLMPIATDVHEQQVEVGKNRSLMQRVRIVLDLSVVTPGGEPVLVARSHGEAMDSGDKATAKAHSVALRTALLQSLCLPTDEPDPDEDVYERAAAQPVQEKGSEPHMAKVELVERALQDAEQAGVQVDREKALGYAQESYEAAEKALANLKKRVAEAGS